MLNFKPYEIVDQKTYETMGDDCLSLFKPDALIMLDDFATFWKNKGAKWILCNNWHEGGQFQWRGYRTVEAAKKLGSPTGHEQHQAGNAFDVDVQGYMAIAVRKIVKNNQEDTLLQKIMRLEANVNWTHLDGKELVLPETRIYIFNA
jgi:hypothetical protein